MGPASVRPGDAIVVSGDLGSHGVAILSVREGLEFEGEVGATRLRCGSRSRHCSKAGIEVHCLRDLTRGGLASALNEIASVARLRIRIEEALIPVSDVVRGACELLGLDPLYVANEGRFVAFVPETDAGRALEILRSRTVSAGAVRAGTVYEDHAGIVTLRSRVGGNRVLDCRQANSSRGSVELLPRAYRVRAWPAHSRLVADMALATVPVGVYFPLASSLT